MAKISACLVVRNEGKVIKRCLDSISKVDEIILIHDGECSDDTLDIAATYKAKIFVFPRSGKVEDLRINALEKATGDWILQIDADEFLSDSLKDQLSTLVDLDDVDAYEFAWPLYDGEKYLDGQPNFEKKMILLRKSKMYMLGIINEGPKTFGTVRSRLDLVLEHQPLYNNYTFNNLVNKWFKWTSLEAKEIVFIEKAKKFNIENNDKILIHYEKLTKHPYLRIIYGYIIKDFLQRCKNLDLILSSSTIQKIQFYRYLNFLHLASRINFYKRKKKRIKIFIDWQPMMNSMSGVGYYLYNLTKNLAKIDTKNNYTLGAFSIHAKKYVFNIGKNFKTRIIRFPSSKYLALMEHKINIPIEIFLGFHDIYFFGNFLRYPLIRGRSASLIHDLTYVKYPQMLESKNLEHLSKLVPYAIRNSNKVITVSKAMQKDIADHYYLDPSQISVIYPVIEFNKPQKVEENNVKNKIPTKKYIFYIGNIEPRKNILRLIEGYKKLPQNIREEYSLILAGGKGWNSEGIFQELDKKIDIGNIVYLGYVNETEREYLFDNASIFAFPSIYEGFGMPILEAMNHNIPVLTSNTSSMPEIAEDAAIYVDPLDSDDISNKLKTLIEDDNLQRDLVEKSKARVEFFKNQNQAQDLYNILMDIL